MENYLARQNFLNFIPDKYLTQPKWVVDALRTICKGKIGLSKNTPEKAQTLISNKMKK